MEEFNELRSRVEETAGKLANLHVERQEQGKSLISTLIHLEEKYSEQEQELAHYKEKMEPLERANQDLAVLLENLSDLIDRGFGEDSLQPMRNATDMASKMLDKDLVAPPVVEETVEAEEEPVAIEMEAEPVPEEFDEEPAELSVETFEEVSDEELEAELEEDPVTDDLPEMVMAFCAPEAIADEEPMMEAEANDTALPGIEAEIDTPMAVEEEEPEEIGFDELVAEAEEAEAEEAPEIVAEPAAEDDTPASTDIRALLERVQALAGKTEAMREDDAGAQAELDEIAKAVEIAQREAQNAA